MLGRRAVALALLTLSLCVSGCIERTSAPPRGVDPIGPIYGGHTAVQTFQPRAAPLIGIDVRLATYARTVSGPLTLQLWKASPPDTGPDLTPVRTVFVEAASVRDNAFHRFRFDAVDPACTPPPGLCTLSFVIQRPTLDPREPVAVWATGSDTESTGVALYDGQPLEGDLVFAPVYQEPLDEAARAQIGALLREPLPPLMALLLLFVPGYLLARLCLGRASSVALRVAASPAFSLAAMALATLYASALGIRLGPWFPWVLLGGSAVGIIVLEVRARSWGSGIHPPPQPSPARGEGVRRSLSPAEAGVGRSRSPARGTGVFSSPSPSTGEGWGGGGVSLAISLAAVLVGLLIRVVALGDGPVPPGADAYHHTVITQLIVDRGALPTSYTPYAPIESFSYHFGFHAAAAAVAWSAGRSALEAVAVVGPLINGLVPLSVFFLVRAAGMGGIAASVAAVLVALVSPFPMQLIAFGRFPQSAALLILPVAASIALGYTWGTDASRADRVRRIIGGGALSAGLFLSHYRMALFFVGLVALYVGWELLRLAWRRLPTHLAGQFSWMSPLGRFRRSVGRGLVPRRAPRSAVAPGGRGQAPPLPDERAMRMTSDPLVFSRWPSLTFPSPPRGEGGREGPGRGARPDQVRRTLWEPVAIGLTALVLAAPWLGRLGEQFTLGIRDSGGRYGPAYYSLERVGDALGHPGFAVLAVLGLLGCSLAVGARQGLVCLLAGWTAVHLLLSNPYWLHVPLAGFVDTATVVATLFLPLGVAAGYLVGHVYLACKGWLAITARPALALGVLLLAAWGVVQLPRLVQPTERLVDSADLAAARWIRDALGPDARFLVNASVQRWQPDFVVATDAGYWLPIVASRPTTLLPMVYPAERGASVAEIDRMERLARVSAADPGAPAALALIREARVSHLYLGARGGPIDERKVAESRAYRRVYQAAGVSIYEIVGSAL